MPEIIEIDKKGIAEEGHPALEFPALEYRAPEYQAPEILMVTAIAGAVNCAAALSKQFHLGVETASSRREAIALLKRREYVLVVIDESMIEAEQDGADGLFRHCGGALPLEVNFAISGYGRVARAVGSALGRRARENEVAWRFAASSMQMELRQTVAGLLLQSELALAEPGVSPQLASKLGMVVALAEELRHRLNGPPPAHVPGLEIAHAVVPGAQKPRRTALPAALARAAVVGHGSGLNT